MTDSIGARLVALHARIAAAAARAGRSPDEITLIGIAKRKPASLVAEAVAAGLRDVGENYVQESERKLPEVHALLERRGIPPPRWHFVGQLQRNKARQVATRFDCVATLDRAELGRELDRRASAAGRTLDALFQVNISREPQKGGALAEELPALLEASAEWKHLRAIGLMAIPAADADARPAFAALRRLRDELTHAPGGAELRELSMGMSSDFEAAIEEGATCVRVGTALFGPRD